MTLYGEFIRGYRDVRSEHFASLPRYKNGNDKGKFIPIWLARDRLERAYSAQIGEQQVYHWTKKLFHAPSEVSPYQRGALAARSVENLDEYHRKQNFRTKWGYEKLREAIDLLNNTGNLRTSRVVRRKLKYI